MTKNKYILLLLALIGFFSYSCKDDYNDHYDRSGDLPDENLYELMKSHPELSSFVKLVEIGSYQDTLSTSQTYTIWAPDNDALADIDLGTISVTQARLIVGNHIARFNNPTSTPDGKTIRMDNKKIYTYSSNGTMFSGVQIEGKNMRAKNGLLHTLKGQIPYHYNLYEYIKATPETSKFKDFISLFDEEIFDPDASSTYIDPETNQLMYDSVMIFYNRLFDDPVRGLGYIHEEDSIYTMLMPSDAAWDAAYTRISPSFVVYNANSHIADSIKNVQTSLAIVNDLIYRGYIANPASQDSLRSTSPSIIYDPADLFSGTVSESASNGLVFKTDELRYSNIETWNKPIEVEGETEDYRVAPTGNTSSYTTKSVAAGGDIFVSGLRYLEVNPTSPSVQPEVKIQIPNLLSGKYNIYVEFIPGSIEGAPNDSTRLQYILTYRDARGSEKNELTLDKNLITSGTKKVKMKVFSEFNFPASNYYDRLWMIDLSNGIHTRADMKVNTSLKIQTNVTTAEYNNNIFTRNFRVDRIIFEPVVK